MERKSAAQEQALKVAQDLASVIEGSVYDSALGLYRIQEHVQSRLPLAVAESRKVSIEADEQLELALGQTQDMVQTVEEWQQASVLLQRISDRLSQVIAQKEPLRSSTAAGAHSRTQRLLRSVSQLVATVSRTTSENSLDLRPNQQ